MKIKVGVLTFSDGREEVHKQVNSICEYFQNLLIETLNKTNEIGVVIGDEIIWSPESAAVQAKN